MSNPHHVLTNQQLMNQAIAALQRAGANFNKKTGFQLKVGPFSFYPGKGSIYRDGEISARKETGLPAFLRLLRDGGFATANDKPVQPVDDPEVFVIDLDDEDDGFETR